MKIIKIFLASSDELLEDRIAFGDFVRRLDSLYKKRGISIELFKWEDFEAYYTKRRKQDEYNDKIKESDFFLALFHTKAGKFTIEEFNVAKDEYDRNSSPLVYVYCKDLSTEDIESAELAEFKKTLSEKMEHYWGHYNNQDSLQLQFALQLRQVESYGIIEGVNVDNGIVKMDGMPISKMDNLKFAASNEEYIRLHNEILVLNEKIERARLRIEKYPEDIDFQTELQQYLYDREIKNKEFDKLQKELFNMALMISQLQREIIEDNTKRAIAAFEEGDYKKARIILGEAEMEGHKCLEELRRSKKLTELNRKNVLMSIPKIHLKCITYMEDSSIDIKERVSKVLDSYEQIDEMANEVNYDFKKQAQLFFCYAEFLRKYGYYSQAIGIYHRIEDLYEGKLDTRHILYAYINNNMGIAYSEMHNFTEATSCLLYALEICIDKFGEEHPKTITTLNNIGGVYLNKKEYKTALKYLLRAAQLGEKVLGNRSSSTAKYYNNIGHAYTNMLDYSLGSEYFLKAIDILKGIIGEDHPEIALIYNNLGMNLLYQHDSARAIAYHKKAIEIIQNTLGKSHYSLVTFYKNLGMDYGYDDNYELECEQYYKALEILERNPIYSKNEINSINTLLEKAKSYLTHG